MVPLALPEGLRRKMGAIGERQMPNETDLVGEAFLRRGLTEFIDLGWAIVPRRVNILRVF
jgi:hypothetical protein